MYMYIQMNVFLHSYALSQTHTHNSHIHVDACRHELICTPMLTPTCTHHTRPHTCRFVSPTESQFFEVTMKVGRSLKCMGSMMSVWGNMVTPMSGSILLTSSTTFLSLPLWMDRWKGGGGRNFGLFPSPFLLLFIGMRLNFLLFWAFCHFLSLASPMGLPIIFKISFSSSLFSLLSILLTSFIPFFLGFQLSSLFL